MLTQSNFSEANPACNTGLICQNTPFTVRVDGFNFVAPVPDLEAAKELLEFVCKCFNDAYQLAVDVPITCGRRFASTIRTVTGMRGGFNPAAGSFSAEVYLQVKGKTCSRVEQKEVISVMALLLHHYNAKFTRIDIALDDYSKRVQPEQILAAINRGDTAHFRNYTYVESSSDWGKGWTIGFGSRESIKYLRYYNKEVESKGAIKAYRWEVELHDNVATQFAEMVVDCFGDSFEELVSVLIAETVLGVVDFVDRDSADRLSRCSRLEWWQSFIDVIGATIRLSKETPKKTLEKTFTWIDKQVQTSLAMVFQFLGEKRFKSWLASQLKQGKKRFTRLHELMIDVAKNEVDSYGFAEIGAT